MAFVHSLVETKMSERTGWCAPVELGEAAPHYISFVIPVADNHDFLDKYTCETVTIDKGQQRIETHELIKQGEDSFALRLGKIELWFTVRPSPKQKRCLPYVGKLGHEDFRYLFVEIEPEDPGKLDELYDDNNTFIIGCEFFTHYAGINKMVKDRHSVER